MVPARHRDKKAGPAFAGKGLHPIGRQFQFRTYSFLESLTIASHNGIERHCAAVSLLSCAYVYVKHFRFLCWLIQPNEVSWT